MAVRQANLPDPLSLEGNVHQNWLDFLSSFEIYLGAIGDFDKSDEELTALSAAEKAKYLNGKGKLFLNIAGKEAIKLYRTFSLSEADKFNFNILKERFEGYAVPQVNVTYNRFMFNRCRQQEGQTFDQFLAEARKRLKDCKFGELEDSLLRDRIVEGIRDHGLRTALLRNADLDLNTAVKDCRAAEQSKAYSKEMKDEEEVKTDANRFFKKKFRKTSSYGKSDWKSGKQRSNDDESSHQSKFKCSKCSYSHDYGKCPAYGKTCVRCGEKNHFQSRCPSEKKSKIHALQVNDEENNDREESECSSNSGDEDCFMYADSVVTVNSVKTEYRQDLRVEGKVVNFKLDPGASMSILPLKVFKELKTKKRLKNCNIMIKPYGRKAQAFPALGSVELVCQIPKQTELIRFLVTDDAETPLLGIKDCERFQFIVRNVVDIHSVQVKLPDDPQAFIKENGDVFQGIGKFPGTHALVIKEGAKQIIRPHQRKPTSVTKKLEPALKQLEKDHIIEKVDQISPDCWVSNIVIVEKPNGKIRICLDPSDLNEVILRQPHPIPTISELSERLNHKKFYSLLDLRDGFYHIELDEGSRNKCCFSTPFGTFRFLRCPFGVASAPEMFQRINESVFGGIPNIIIFFDDILIHMYMSDLFSRYVKNAPRFDDPVEETVHSLTRALPLSSTTKAELVAATREDSACSRILDYVREGWPKHVHQAPENVQSYWKFRNQVFQEDGLLYYNDHDSVRVIVPQALRKKFLSWIHEGHMGVEKCESRAKECFFWPKMLQHVSLFVNQCKTCEKLRPMAKKHPLKPHPIPALPWERVSMDIASVSSKDYLVMYDAYSKWLEIKPLKGKSASNVIDVCTDVFATHGFPAVLLADNNPCDSFEFRNYAKANNFDVVTSSPNFPSSNGRAEKGVSIAKSILKKALLDHSDYRNSLREYNNTVIPHMGASPSQLLFSRKLRSLPVSANALKPRVQKDVRAKLQAQQERTMGWYNKSAKRKDFTLKPGEKIAIKCNKKETWQPATVVKKCDEEPRSYLVRNNKGHIIRRTLQHITKSVTPIEEENLYDHYPLSSQTNNVKTPELVITNVPAINNQTHSKVKAQINKPQPPTYQLIVPEWLFNANQRVSSRISKPVQRYQPM
ncbi:hypothetical protein KUF71_016890 [Frankliniella fusca]|uniref:RNA-directed DNA polymerase n=1 Tax=Frankliniella fusca TaxID=407009 RepID=A0AAE1HY31_9NEOP|nr:hypothetical protein KUF71_016890 [Frankliniella fusca]